VLTQTSTGKTPASETLSWLVPLALKAQASGFVYLAESHEHDLVSDLRGQVEGLLESGSLPSAVHLAVLALYLPLVSVTGVERIATVELDDWPEPLRPLIERAVLQPLKEHKLAAGVCSLGEVNDRTSRAVRSQYEMAPYPRWIMVDSVPARPLADTLRDYLPQISFAPQLSGPVDVLVAGCGTGWAVVEAALAYAGANVIGLDLSRASLSYGLRMACEIELDNASFVQGDILDVERLKKRFDYIQCGGVLHHMADPLAGWKALSGCLKEHGLMKIALYSRLGRRSIAAARAIIAERGIAPIDDNIREFRQFVMQQSADSELAALTTYMDFYYLSGCRDLMFNIQEHQLDLTYISDALNALELEFLGFQFAAPGIAEGYQRAFPAEPTMTNLDNWRQFEEQNPETFRSMYQFWCRRRAP
jgi:SAM-dependent methyltransferase